MAKKLKKGKKAHMSMPVTVKNIDKDNYTLTMVASTQKEDRHGDTVIQDGWDLRQYKKNPVILNSHNYDDATEVIAKATSTKIEGKGKSSKLVQEWKFAVDENPKAKIIFDLYAGGFLSASSVGFIPKKFKEDDYFVIEEAELLEVSAVSVPANAWALAKSKGIVGDEDELPDEMIGDDDPELEEKETEEEQEEPEPEQTEEEPEEEDVPVVDPVLEDVDIKPEEQEPELPEEKKLSKNARLLKAIHSIEQERKRKLKTAYDTIKALQEERGFKGMDAATKQKARTARINKAIRSLTQAK